MKKLEIKGSSVILVANCCLLGAILWDILLKEILNEIGLFRFLAKKFDPTATYYVLTHGIWTVRFIPVSVIFLFIELLYLRKNKESKTKRAIKILVVTILIQVFVLVISLWNNGMITIP